MDWFFSCFGCKPRRPRCLSSSTMQCMLPPNNSGLMNTNFVKTQVLSQAGGVDAQIHSEERLDSVYRGNHLDRSLVSFFESENKCCPPRKCSSHQLLQVEELQEVVINLPKRLRTLKSEQDFGDSQAGSRHLQAADQCGPHLASGKIAVKLDDIQASKKLLSLQYSSSTMTQEEASPSLADNPNALSPDTYLLDWTSEAWRECVQISAINQSNLKEDDTTAFPHKDTEIAREMKPGTLLSFSEVGSVSDWKRIPAHLDQENATKKQLQCSVTRKATCSNDVTALRAETDGVLSMYQPSSNREATSMSVFQDAIFHNTDLESEAQNIYTKESRLSPHSSPCQWFQQANAETVSSYLKEESQISILDDSYDGFSDASSQSLAECIRKRNIADDAERNHDRMSRCSDTSCLPTPPLPQKPSKKNKIFAKKRANVSAAAMLQENGNESGELKGHHESSFESNAGCSELEGGHQELNLAFSETSESWMKRENHESFDLDAWIPSKETSDPRIDSVANTRDAVNLELPSLLQLSDEAMSPLLHCVSESFLVQELTPRTPSSPASSPIETPSSIQSTVSPVDLARKKGIMSAHWSHSSSTMENWDGKGIPNSTKKYKEDQKVSWHATPFEVRLERALAKQGPGSQKKLFGGAKI